MRFNAGMILAASVAAVAALASVPGGALADPGYVTTTPISAELSLQKTVTAMSVPADNQMPWAAVAGDPTDHVPSYPVIIQIIQHGEPVHVAQVGTSEDGSYEYRFRVGGLDGETGSFVNHFEGDYTVNIFRVVPNSDSLSA